MEKEIELLIERLNRAKEINDKEAMLKISEEVDKIISKLLPDENKQTKLKNK